MNYDLIIFDLDNTLLDFDLMEVNSLSEVLKKNNIEPTNEIISIYKKINSKYWSELELGTHTKEVILVKRFEDFFLKLGYEIDPNKFNEDYLDTMENHIYLIDEAKEILEYSFQKSTLVIMTNGVKSAQKNKLKRMDFNKYFSEIIISDEVGYHKPSIEIFKYLENKIGVINKKRTIIVGDSLTSDIKGGNNFNITTCWFNKNKVLSNSNIHTDYEITELKELYNIL